MPYYIIDNKKINMTNDEWQLYQKIVKSYTTAFNRGEDLFMDLFEADENGIIVFLKPPSKRQTSMEVFLFLMSLQQQQTIRIMYDKTADICNKAKEKIAEIDQKLNELSTK